MPRAVNGIYTLPNTVNPVVSGTLIESSWANTTLDDVAQALSDSLDRDGRGSMREPLKLTAGNLAAPGLTFAVDQGIGLYRVSAGVLGVAINGQLMQRTDASGHTLAGNILFDSGRLTVNGDRVIINNAAPYIQFQETDQTLPNGYWRLGGSAGNITLQRNTAVSGDFSTVQTVANWLANGAMGLGGITPRARLELAFNGESAQAFTSSDGPTDQKTWRVGTNSGAGRSFAIDAVNDAYSASQVAYIITKSGISVQTHQWSTNNIERMRLDVQGRLMLNATVTDRRLDVIAPNGHTASVVRSQSVNRTTLEWQQAQFEAYTQVGSTVDFASIALHVQDASNAPQMGFNGTTGRLGFFSSSGDPLMTTNAGGQDLTPSGRIRSKEVSVGFSATPTFDAIAQDIILFGDLTSNVTSMTINNAALGQFLSIRFKQDGTGGRTVAVPSGAKVAGSIGTAANQVSYLNITYNSTDARWEGSWLVLPL